MSSGSIVWNDEGEMYVFGSNSNGCLGIDGPNMFKTPQLLEFFKDEKIEKVFQKITHTMVLTSK